MKFNHSLQKEKKTLYYLRLYFKKNNSNKNTFLSYPHYNAYEAPQAARKNTTRLNCDMKSE